MGTDLLNDDGGQGGGNPPGDNTPPAQIPEGMEFLKGVDTALLNEPAVKNVKDLNSLVKGYVHAQKMIGADKIVVPSKGAPQEQWNEVFTKLGLPSKEAYKLNKPEKSNLGDEFYNQATELGHSLGILPHQMQGFVTKLEETTGAQREAHIAASKRSIEEGIANLKSEWGQAFEAKIYNAKEVLNKFGTDEDKKFISESGLGNNPQFIKFLEKVGSSMKEARIIEGKDDSGSPQDLQGKLDSILRDKNHPYWNRDHVGHANATREVSELFAKLN